MYKIDTKYYKMDDNKYYAILNAYKEYKLDCDNVIRKAPIWCLNEIFINRKISGCKFQIIFDTVYPKVQTPYRKTKDRVKDDVELLIKKGKKSIIDSKLKESVFEIEKLISIQEDDLCIE